MKVEWKEVKGKVLVVVDVEDSIRVCCLCCSKGDGDVGLAEDVVPDVASHRAVFVEDLVHDILGNRRSFPCSGLPQWRYGSATPR